MTAFHLSMVVLIVTFAGLLTGYMAGKRAGRRKAELKVSAETAVRLRQQALQTGVCPTCDRSREDMVQYGTKG